MGKDSLNTHVSQKKKDMGPKHPGHHNCFHNSLVFTPTCSMSGMWAQLQPLVETRGGYL
jgi:hypothetical protein